MLAEMMRLLLLLLQTLLVMLLLVVLLLLLLLVLLLELDLLLVELQGRMRLRKGEPERLMQSDGVLESRVGIAAHRSGARVDPAAGSRSGSGRQPEHCLDAGRLQSARHGRLFRCERRARAVVLHVRGPVAALLHRVVQRHGVLRVLAHAQRRLVLEIHRLAARAPPDRARQPVAHEALLRSGAGRGTGRRVRRHRTRRRLHRRRIVLRVVVVGPTRRRTGSRRLASVAEASLGRGARQHVLSGELVLRFHSHLFHVREQAWKSIEK